MLILWNIYFSQGKNVKAILAWIMDINVSFTREVLRFRGIALKHRLGVERGFLQGT